MQHGSLITVEYQTVNYVSGPLIFVERPKEISFGETAQIILPDGEARTGQILDISEDVTVVQVFEGTRGIDSHVTTVRFTGQSPLLDVSYDMLGRVLDGVGRPRDGGPAIIPEARLDIAGMPINPYSRDKPAEFIQTGISAIDALTPLSGDRNFLSSQVQDFRQISWLPRLQNRQRFLVRVRTLPWSLQRWVSPTRKRHSS